MISKALVFITFAETLVKSPGRCTSRGARHPPVDNLVYLRIPPLATIPPVREHAPYRRLALLQVTRTVTSLDQFVQTPGRGRAPRMTHTPGHRQRRDRSLVPPIPARLLTFSPQRQFL
jgi:hypothetical protein